MHFYRGGGVFMLKFPPFARFRNLILNINYFFFIQRMNFFIKFLSFFEKRLEKDSFFESESLENLRLGLKVRVFVGLGLESDSDSDSDSKVESESESLKLSPALCN